jgi:hypothetical protein
MPIFGDLGRRRKFTKRSAIAQPQSLVRAKSTAGATVRLLLARLCHYCWRNWAITAIAEVAKAVARI